MAVSKYSRRRLPFEHKKPTAMDGPRRAINRALGEWKVFPNPCREAIMDDMGTMGKELPRSKVFRSFLMGLAACLVGALSAASGCVEQPTQLQPLPGSSGSSSSSGTSGGTSLNPGRDLFAAMEADLMKSCGMCHDVAGLADTPFLAGPDRYQSFVSWPAIVTSVPDQSILLTYSIVGGGHSGLNLDSPALKDTLLPKVKAWLAEEAKTATEAPPPIGPYMVPFVPIIGFNSKYLRALGKEFEGMAITFYADYLTDTTLELTDIQIHPTTKAGVHVVHPLFTMYPVGADPIPEPGDSFSNVDQTYAIGKGGQLGPGTFVFPNWQKDARLSIAFEKIEVILPMVEEAGPGPTGGCKDTQAFIDNARVPLQQRCLGCHGGGNGQATAALDMSELAADAAKACAQVLNRVNPGDPPSSQIFVTTNPNGNAAHPYKFGGNADTFNTFRSNLSTWIALEK